MLLTTKAINRQGRRFSKAVREAAGCPASCYPIIIVDGFDAPALLGKSYFHTNKSGDIISYPNAYRRAWGKPIYHGSTLRIEVGAGWLIENDLA